MKRIALNQRTKLTKTAELIIGIGTAITRDGNRGTIVITITGIECIQLDIGNQNIVIQAGDATRLNMGLATIKVGEDGGGIGRRRCELDIVNTR